MNKCLDNLTLVFFKSPVGDQNAPVATGECTKMQQLQLVHFGHNWCFSSLESILATGNWQTFS